jgi:hypothetical protein
LNIYAGIKQYINITKLKVSPQIIESINKNNFTNAIFASNAGFIDIGFAQKRIVAEKIMILVNAKRYFPRGTGMILNRIASASCCLVYLKYKVMFISFSILAVTLLNFLSCWP